MDPPSRAFGEHRLDSIGLTKKTGHEVRVVGSQGSLRRDGHVEGRGLNMIKIHCMISKKSVILFFKRERRSEDVSSHGNITSL